MALKDASQLVKMYAMVNVQQYNVVATGTSVSSCIESYEQLLAENGISIEGGHSSRHQRGVGRRGGHPQLRHKRQQRLLSQVEGGDVYYTVSAADSPVAAILNVGDRVALNAPEDAAGPLVSASGLEIG